MFTKEFYVHSMFYYTDYQTSDTEISTLTSFWPLATVVGTNSGAIPKMHQRSPDSWVIFTNNCVCYERNLYTLSQGSLTHGLPSGHRSSKVFQWIKSSTCSWTEQLKKGQFIEKEKSLIVTTWLVQKKLIKMIGQGGMSLFSTSSSNRVVTYMQSSWC